MASPIPEERVKELASEVRDTWLEVKEGVRARRHGFNGDFRHNNCSTDSIELKHKKNNVTIKYVPFSSDETIATVVIRAPMSSVLSRGDYNERIARLDSQKATLQNLGVRGGVFTSYKGFGGQFGYQYELQVPITNESDLDRLLDICNTRL